jgi:multicomponent Na+:H+ antiporter subunit A
VLNLIGLHALAALGAWVSSRWIGRRCWIVAAAAPSATLAWAVWRSPGVVSGQALVGRRDWVNEVELTLDFRLDPLSLLMVYVVSAVGVAIVIYAARYTSSGSEAGRLTAGLTIFAGTMLGIVLSDNVFLLWGFWEGTTLLSYLLIAFQHTDEGARSAALKALLVNAAGGLAMLGGLALVAGSGGTSNLTSLLRSPPEGIAGGMALILVGILVKSAQVPFHGWLPAAMVAPTPVSAYLHAAAMVKAGPYLLIRLAPLVVGLAWWQPTVITVGLAGALFGGYRAMKVDDLKELLAYTTIAELGLMFVLSAVDTPEATAAALLLLVSHAAFKGCLFMATGIVDHQLGSRRIEAVRGMVRTLPVVASVAALAILSMAGLPPFLGFVAEDEGFKALNSLPLGNWTWPVLVTVAAATVLKAAFSTRLVLAAVSRSDPPESEEPRPGPWWTGPPAVLALAGLALGIFSEPVGSLVGAVATPSREESLDIGLWHGLTPALGLTVLTLVLGVGAGFYRMGWERLSVLTARFALTGPDWGRVTAGLTSLGDRLEGRGGRRGNLAVVLIGATVAAGVALLAYEGESAFRLPTNLAVVVVAALVAMASIGVVLTRRRLLAILLLSATGYGVALLYLALDAPNLTFTQLLVETLLLVALLTVAWRLALRSPTVPRIRRVARLTTALIAGAGLTAAVGLTYETGGVRTVSVFYETRREVGVEFHNTVTAILVDFRALDTLGELTVLVTAALALLALYPVLHRSEPILTEQRSPILTVAVDVLYPPVLLFGVYLFFAGHVGVGGGFPAGLVAAVALVLRHTAHQPGVLEIREFLPGKMVGAAAVLAAGTAIWSLAVGEAVLENLDLSFHLPGIGTVAASSSLLFEAALALAVTGLGLTILSRLERAGS